MEVLAEETEVDPFSTDPGRDQESELQAPRPKFFITRKVRRQFKKSNSLVHHTPHQVMTPVQQKLTNILLRNAQHNQSVGDLKWEIGAAEIMRTMRIETRNYKHVVAMIQQMMNIKIRWNELEDRGEANHFAVVFPRVTYVNGQITYQIHADAAALLHNLGSYTALDIDEQMELSKNCSIPLYETATRYLAIGQSRWFLWEQLRNLLLTSSNIPVNARKWASFNERYLAPAVKDVNAKTPLHIEIETERVGAAVKSVRIRVERQGTALSQSALTTSQGTRGILIDAMRSLGVREREAVKVLAEYSPEQITAALDHTKKRRDAQGMVALKLPRKYFTDSLKYRWYQERDLFSDVDEPIAPTKRKKATDVGMTKMRNAVLAQRIKDVKIILGEINPLETEKLYQRYNDSLGTDGLHIKRGRNKAGVVAAFQKWYSKELYGEDVTADEMLKFMARKIAGSDKLL